MADIRQTKEWAVYLTNLGWMVEKINGNYIHIKKLPFFGSYIKIPRPLFPLDLETVDQIARQHHTLMVKITPKIEADSSEASSVHARLIKHGYVKEYWTPTVSKTMVVDLTKSEHELLKSFHKNTRFDINFAKRNGIKVIQSDDINESYKLYLQTASRNKFTPQSFKDAKTRFLIFKKTKKAILLFALSSDKEYLATLLILLNSKDRLVFCSLSGTAKTHRNLRASHLLYWEAMLLTKKMGYKSFDFDGIYDKQYRSTKNWAGFTFFKRGFKGKETTYLGSYIKFYNPILQLLFSLYSHLFVPNLFHY